MFLLLCIGTYIVVSAIVLGICWSERYRPTTVKRYVIDLFLAIIGPVLIGCTLVAVMLEGLGFNSWALHIDMFINKITSCQVY